MAVRRLVRHRPLPRHCGSGRGGRAVGALRADASPSRGLADAGPRRPACPWLVGHSLGGLEPVPRRGRGGRAAHLHLRDGVRARLLVRRAAAGPPPSSARARGLRRGLRRGPDRDRSPDRRRARAIPDRGDSPAPARLPQRERRLLPGGALARRRPRGEPRAGLAGEGALAGGRNAQSRARAAEPEPRIDHRRGRRPDRLPAHQPRPGPCDRLAAARRDPSADHDPGAHRPL